MLQIEAPYVQVLDARLSVNPMHRRTLTQGYGKQTRGVPPAKDRPAGKEIVSIPGGDGTKPSQILIGDRFKRALFSNS